MWKNRPLFNSYNVKEPQFNSYNVKEVNGYNVKGPLFNSYDVKEPLFNGYNVILMTMKVWVKLFPAHAAQPTESWRVFWRWIILYLLKSWAKSGSWNLLNSWKVWIKLVWTFQEMRFMTGRLKSMDEENEIESDWKFAAMVIDRFYHCYHCYFF